MMPETVKEDLRDRMLRQCMHVSETAEYDVMHRASELDSFSQPFRSLHPIHAEILGCVARDEEYIMKR